MKTLIERLNEKESFMKRIKRKVSRLASIVVCSLGFIGCGDDDNGGNAPINPERTDTLSQMSNAPSVYSSNILDFLETSSSTFAFSPEANTAIDSVDSYFTSGESIVRIGANQYGIACEVDETGDNIPDYALRFSTSTTATSPYITSQVLNEISSKLESIPSETEAKQLVTDYFEFKWPSNTTIYDIANVSLPLTGKYVPVTVQAENDLGTGNVSANFTYNPDSATQGKIDDERNLNGQSAGTTYTGVSIDAMLTTDSKGRILEKTSITRKYHEDNN